MPDIDARQRNPKDEDRVVKLFTAGLRTSVGFLKSIADGFTPERQPAVVDHFDLADVVRYFSNVDRSDPTVAAGAILARPHASGSLLSMVLLDAEGNICTGPNGNTYGRQIVARRIDQELAHHLAAGKGMVIFN